MDEKGKMRWEVQVEPPEDMDKAGYDIDPRMMIWKSMRGSEAGEDLDKLHHPSLADLLGGQVQNQGAIPDADVQMEEAHVKHYQEPEEDKEHIHHPVFSKVDGQLVPLVAGVKADAELVQGELLDSEARVKSEIRIHFYPEEDMDHLYHKDVPQPVLYEAAADVPSHRRHTEPEEDLDHLYHKWSFSSNFTCVNSYHSDQTFVADVATTSK